MWTPPPPQMRVSEINRQYELTSEAHRMWVYAAIQRNTRPPVIVLGNKMETEKVNWGRDGF